MRPEPLRLDLLTDTGLHFAQAVLAWVGAGFPSSRWRNEQPVSCLCLQADTYPTYRSCCLAELLGPVQSALELCVPEPCILRLQVWHTWCH